MLALRTSVILVFVFILAPNLVKAATWKVAYSEENGVADIQEAFQKAQPGDEIVIEGGVYLSDEDMNADYPFALRNKRDITISSEGGAYLLATQNHTTPGMVEFCENIRFDNIHFGHAVERGYCCGMVIKIVMSSEVTFMGCVIHGSGTIGIFSKKSSNISFNECAIVDCTMTATTIIDSEDIYFFDCLFVNNDDSYAPGELFNYYGLDELNIQFLENCLIMNNKCKSLGIGKEHVIDCIITSNTVEDGQNFDLNEECKEYIDHNFYIDLARSLSIGPRSNVAAEAYYKFRQQHVYPRIEN